MIYIYIYIVHNISDLDMIILSILVAVRGLPHALFFPGRDWSGAWARLNARRLAVPKDPRFGPPPPEEARFGPSTDRKN